MAIVYDTVSSGSNTGSATLTFSHTCDAGADFLVVCVTHRRGADDVSGVTYNGTAMTRGLHSVVNTGSYLYYLVAPTAGSAEDVVITVNAGTDRALLGTSMSFTGVKQVDPKGATASAEEGLTSKSTLDTVITTTEANSVIVQSWTQTNGSDATLTPNNITETDEAHQAGAALGANHAAGYKITTAVTDYTTGWSSSLTGQMESVTVEFFTAGGGAVSAATTPTLLTMGVG